eukprot:12327324-Karenia_brevis.AAC.1
MDESKTAASTSGGGCGGVAVMDWGWQAGLADAYGWVWQTVQLEPGEQAQTQDKPQVCANRCHGDIARGN